MPQFRRVSSWRRTKLAAVGVAGALVVTTLAGTGSSGAVPQQQPALSNNGVGTAQATGLFVDPVAGGLSFGVGVGQALAGHQNTVGSAESRSYDLGVIGVTLAAESCDGGDPTLPDESQPQPLRASSTDPAAANGASESEEFAFSPILKFVRATTEPLGEAITTVGPIDIPGILRIDSIQTVARSGVVNGVREAFAETSIGSISLANGAVKLRNLVWTARHTSTDDDETTEGTFSLSGPTEALEQANAILGVLGIEIIAPQFRVAEVTGGSISIIDPLTIQVVPNALRDGILNPVLLALQPIREALFTTLLDLSCDWGTYITVADVVIQSLTGGGFFAVKLGGATASTAALSLFEFPQAPALGPVTPPASTGGGSIPAAVAGTPSASIPPAAVASPPAAPSGPVEEAVETIADDGERGGVMAAVAGGGLLLLLLVAALDHRKMRRAQRLFPLEA